MEEYEVQLHSPQRTAGNFTPEKIIPDNHWTGRSVGAIAGPVPTGSRTATPRLTWCSLVTIPTELPRLPVGFLFIIQKTNFIRTRQTYIRRQLKCVTRWRYSADIRCGRSYHSSRSPDSTHFTHVYGSNRRHYRSSHQGSSSRHHGCTLTKPTACNIPRSPTSTVAYTYVIRCLDTGMDLPFYIREHKITFWFHKTREISRLAEDFSAS